MSAPKLLAYCDAGNRTGFERVAREILSPLHESGRFDVTVYGIGYRGTPDIKYPYPVYPAGTDADMLGIGDAPKVIKKHQPDVMWALQDMWNISRYVCVKPPTLPMAVYYPLDAPNLKFMYATGVAGSAAVSTYANFGARETAAGLRDFVDIMVESARKYDINAQQRQWMELQHPMGVPMYLRMDRLAKYQNPAAYTVVPHGLDLNAFQPRDKQAARKLFGLKDDDFVVLNVNTNQERKRLDLTFRTFARFAAQHDKAHLVLHCAGHTTQGWDLQQLAILYGLQDRVTLVHETTDTLSEDQLVELYNTADVQINTGGGEGWGLTAFEGAACGVPQIVPDWSVTRDLWQDHGLHIPVRDYWVQPKFLNTAHAVIDTVAAATLLKVVADSEDLRAHLRFKALELVHQQPTWADVSNRMGNVIQAALEEPREAPKVTFEELVAARIGDVQSELRTCEL